MLSFEMNKKATNHLVFRGKEQEATCVIMDVAGIVRR